MDHIVFLTGRLAQAHLERVLGDIQPTPFSWEVREIGVQVAALMTGEMIMRRVPAPLVSRDEGGTRRCDRMILPGRCRGDLQALSAHYGVPVVRGPDELKDLPRYFAREAKPVSLDDYRVAIFAEIVDAPRLDVAAILAKARQYRADGADVIDLGGLPETRFDHLETCVRELKAEGFKVSVDSHSSDELLRGGRAGADYLLSLDIDRLWIAGEVAATPVLIPREPSDEASLLAAIEAMQARWPGRRFLADPILDPVPFGLTRSIVRYQRLRERCPEVAILMGVGNVTELIEADTCGMNALLFGIAAELDVAAVLTTQVSRHARRAVAEADLARRVMHAARQTQSLPKAFSDGLMTVHAKHPFPDSPAEIEATAAQVRDPNFRVQIAVDGLHVYNRDGHRIGPDPFALWPQLHLHSDAEHAFYMGVELARAEIAWQLGKRYVQDRALDWGCAVAPPSPGEATAGSCAPGTTRRQAVR